MKLTTFNKLKMIIDLIDGGYHTLAYQMTTQFGRDTLDPNPVIAKFITNQERRYWIDLEPMITDMKVELYKTDPST